MSSPTRRTTHPSTSRTRPRTATPAGGLAPAATRREVDLALRAVEALGGEPSFADLAPVVVALAEIPPGGRAELYGAVVERAGPGRYRILSPWCGRKLSGTFGPSGPVARRLLREKLVRSWLADE